MKLTDAQIQSMIDFQPKSRPRSQPRWERTVMWLLIMLILLAVVAMQEMRG